MAVKTFDETLAQLSADERKLFDSTLSKYPELKEGWLRQDDYSRKLNEFTAKEKDFEEAQAEKEKWEAWADRNVPIWDSLAEKGIIDKETGEELWTKQKSDLEHELEEARRAAVAGADMKPEELDARVKEIVKQAGGVTKEEYQALLQSEGKKIAKETFGEEWKAKESDFNTKTIPFVAGFSTAATMVAKHFEEETGERWNAERQKSLYDLMSKEGNFDPYAMEDKILAPYREKKTREKEIQEEVEKRTKAIRVEQGGNGEESYIPQPGENKGALRQMLERSAEPEDFQALIASKAREASAALRAEGKG